VPVVGGDGRARFSIMHGDERLVVTAEEAARLHEALSERLMSARRLILVLDLDLTLIHATTARELQDTTNRLGKVRES
jgi:RNA polymerase II subunit A-like phosphatase